MTSATLQWQLETQGVRFWVKGRDGSSIDPWQWGLYDLRVEDRSGSAAALLALLDEGLIQPDKQSGLCASHGQLAALSESQLQQLGLPPAAPYRLHIRGQGILTSPRFRFQFQLTGHDGRPVVGITRQGLLIKTGSRQYTLLDPLYTLVEGMEAFNALPPEDLDSRFLRWAELKTLLPEDVEVDRQLRTLNVVRADAFTLDLDDQGHFDPRLLARSRLTPAEEEALPPGQPVLPDAAQEAFRHRFRALPRAQARYSTGANWYVVIPPQLRQALDVVRERQEAPPAERQAFIANPQAVLRERLPDLDESLLDALFEETPTFVSDRIQRLGQWQPRLCAYVLPTRQDWLPPEEQVLGLPLGGGLYNIPVKDLPQLKAMVEEALAQGLSQVDWQGQKVPVSEETLSDLERCLEQTKMDKAAGAETVEKQPAPIGPAHEVPIIYANTEAVDYVARRRLVAGEVGGIPAVLTTRNLFAHQTQGLAWLQEHWVAGSPGALLADDMGLGKTLQTLAFLAWVQEQMQAGHHPHRPLLVVAPTGLLKNWQDEAAIHLAAPGLGRLFRAYGQDMGQLRALSHLQRLERLRQADWVLTTYETLRDKIRYFIGLEWGVAVFDEAQKIKNPTSRLTEMAKSIQADFQLMLTGTPVENRLADLWSILDAAAPGLLGSLKEFHRRYEKTAVEDPQALEPLKAHLTQETQPAVMLRRLKEDCLKGLPEKRQKLIRATMPPTQAQAYAQWVTRAAAIQGKRGAMLEILQGLRSVSLLSEPPGPEGLTDELVATSARLTALMEILDDIHQQGQKVLIFLESLDLQAVLAPYLQRRYQLPRLPLRITGSVAGQVRKAHVDTFQSQPVGQFDVMLLSPRAGGVGLTLTAANHVIHLSRWWNPAVEDQCTDRVYRIGQSRPVTVYYPLAVHPTYGDHSFDLNLHQLLERKRHLSYSLLAPPLAGDRDLEELFAASI